MLAEFMKYTQIADAKLINLFQQHKNVPEKAIFLFSHILNAQHNWACRILDREPSYQVWENHDPKTYAKISAVNFELLNPDLGGYGYG
jgi:hypothetical protein